MADVLIIGGSVAGLSAALILARCCRSLIICDTGRPRNRFSHSMHGFLSREGISPKEFISISRKQVQSFPDVRFFDKEITTIRWKNRRVSAMDSDGNIHVAKAVLLATGIADELPDIPNVDAFYGTSIHHCPYCDGWEHRDQPLAVHGLGMDTVDLAEEMRIWSKDVVYCTHGAPLFPEVRMRIKQLELPLYESRITGLKGKDGQLESIVFADGEVIERSALFFTGPQTQNCSLARQLECEVDGNDFVKCSDDTCTSVKGVFAAGNTSTGLQLAIIAAAEGAKAAHAINTYLMEEQA